MNSRTESKLPQLPDNPKHSVEKTKWGYPLALESKGGKVYYYRTREDWYRAHVADEGWMLNRRYEALPWYKKLWYKVTGLPFRG
ncbi:hypothetical protein [Nesterenkonia alba]|uniref:hypothetical protein n=1 Tax=Nesterenkonia alba TaxID=515814 RepID=UPI0003B49992|nr:hypothetical protein [Nesterenkonia alba]